jgi:uncharacterized protein
MEELSGISYFYARRQAASTVGKQIARRSRARLKRFLIGAKPVDRRGNEMADKNIAPEQLIASLLEGRSRRELMVILARLEHGAAGIYESLASQEQNQKAREALLAGAKREEQNSALLKLMTTLKDKCEKCGKPVPDAADALTCSFQCTFCPECASGYNNVCPNCSGELTVRATIQ